ncbi:PREDICTED: ankyrin-3 isoform X1 [Drosophila arizonae]|uniref:Ankyrin-3 isoform X1 n=1 Tax=Drosophila arizonae TaxID=7263 RepID=A0ABM1PPA7_DROAR|nr:PREDICTED: ankyrin-3 isoform X1 [Drosophila arizonae]
MTLDDPQNDIQTNTQRNETAKKRAQLQTNQNYQPMESEKLDKNNITVNHQKQNDATISFLRAARSGDLGKVLEFIDSGLITNINTCNANGLNALHLAAKDGYVDICNELLKRGILVDSATKKGNTALHIASLAGQQQVIKQLIQYNANVNVQSLNGFTPLYMAAQENHDSCCRLLLSKGANPSLATEDGFTPLAVAMQQGHDKVVAVLLESDVRGKVRLPALHIAAKKNDVNAATLLLRHDKNADIVSKSGFTPLHIAAHYGNVDIANVLLECGADVNYAAKHNITPLHVACKWGKAAVCRLLLAKRARIDAITRDGLTPLHCASRSGHVEVIQLLLSQHAPILSKTKNGLSALHMSAQGEHDEAARLLLDYKAPVDEVTVDYLTALHVAAHCGHVRVAKLLLDYGANPNSRALNGFTPLHIACKKNRIKVAELLIQHGANIRATTESGLTPLHVASFMGCMNIVIYLLQHDASPDMPTIRGETPLHLAARANQTDIIRILLRNGAQVDAVAREGQTPLHVAARLGNIDIIMLMLQHGAQVNACTKDMYTALHIAAKEGKEEVCQLLMEHGAQLESETKKGFTPLHLASKYGKANVADLLIKKGAVIDCQGKNDVTPLHVATHYDHQPVVLLLLEKGASAQISARNGHSALHIAAKKSNIETAQGLLQHGADVNATSKSGFSPVHLAAQEGHVDMVQLLLEQSANANISAKNGLTPLHLAAQEGHVQVSQTLLNYGACISERTKAGYTPLHIAAHYNQINEIKFLLENDANIEMTTNVGYTPLHQAAQQGHTMVINLLLRHKANPDALTNNGQTALNIAHNLGYVTAVETLKIVTEKSVINTTTGVLEEKYKVVVPEFMHETLLSDSDDEGGNEVSDHNQYKYMATDDLKATNDHDNHNFNTTDPEIDRLDGLVGRNIEKELTRTDETILNASPVERQIDNVIIVRPPIHLGFLVSFLVDARGGSMRGCRHSGVRIIVPPKACSEPTRITCRYVKPQRVANPPPLMEGEALVSRILEMSPVTGKFLSPIVLEVPHFGSLRDKEREIIILRSDNGESWREHSVYEDEGNLLETLKETMASDVNPLEDLHTSRIIRIVTQNVPHFFAVVSRVRQEVHTIGPDGGTVSSIAVPQVQSIFPPHALTKKIRVGLQAQPVDLIGCSKLLGQGVAVSPVVTVEPRRRKFHKAITLSIPAPKTCNQGMVNSPYNATNGNVSAPTLRLLCSITGGQNRAVWEDVTGSTPLAFVKDSVSFTTTVSARFWLMDCRNVADAGRMATELYTYMAKVPFMVKFVVFAKQISATEAKLSVFCMTDDKEDKTLEQQEYFAEVAKSRDVEVLQDQNIYLEFAGNLVPVLKSGEQLNTKFQAFRENRLSFIVYIKDQEQPHARISFMSEPKVTSGEAPLRPICTLNVSLESQKLNRDKLHPNGISTNGNNNTDHDLNYKDLINAEIKCNTESRGNSNINPLEDEIQRANIRLSDISNLLGSDWPQLAEELGVPEIDINLVETEYADQPVAQQGLVMLRLWLKQEGNRATGNTLSQALNKIGREDIVEKCIFNLELVTDQLERGLATTRMQHDHTLMQYLADGLNETLNIGQQSNEEELCRSNEQSNNDKSCATPPSTPIEVNEDSQEYQYNISTPIPEIMQKILEEPRVNEVENDLIKPLNKKDIEKFPESSEEKLVHTLAEKYKEPTTYSTLEGDLNVFQAENNSKTKITNIDPKMKSNFLKKFTED